MNQDYEKEINLIHLFFSLLYHWRSLLVAALLGALLLAGYKFADSSSVLPGDEAAEALEEYEHTQELYELTAANYEAQLASYEDQMKQLHDYMESSVLMQIDPLSVYYASADIFVEVADEELQSMTMVDDSDVVYPLTQAYVSFVTKSLDVSILSEKYHISEAALRELISAGASSESDTIVLRVIADSPDLADDIMNTILEQVKNESANISSDMMRHTIKIRNQACGIVSDSALMEKINDINQQLLSLSNNINKTTKDKDALEEPEELEISGAAGVSKKSLLKFAILGFLAGGIVLAAVYVLVYMLSGAVHTNAEIKDAFGYYLIGGFAPTYRHQGAVDKWLQGLAKSENRSDDVIYDRIVSNIKSLAQDNKKLLLTGTVGEDLLSEVGEKLKELLPDLSVSYSGSFLEDASVMMLASDADAVILLEKCGESSFAAITKEVESMQALNKKILGYIMK